MAAGLGHIRGTTGRCGLSDHRPSLEASRRGDRASLRSETHNTRLTQMAKYNKTDRTTRGQDLYQEAVEKWLLDRLNKPKPQVAFVPPTDTTETDTTSGEISN